MVDYVYVESRGAHGHHAVGSFDALVGSHREIWIGSDCSGLIRETSGPVSFFTPDGETRWRAAGSPNLEGSGIDLFAPGCIGTDRSELAQLPLDPARLADELSRRVPLTLPRVCNLLGESLVEPDLCRDAPVGTSVSWARSSTGSWSTRSRKAHHRFRVRHARRQVAGEVP